MVETLHERLLALAKEKYEKTIVRQVRHEAYGLLTPEEVFSWSYDG